MNINSTFFGRGIASLTRSLATLLLLLFLSSGASASPYVFAEGSIDVADIDWTNPVRAINQIQEMKFAEFNHQATTTAEEDLSSTFVAMPCFVGFSAGDDVSYCSGDTATLDGGYNSYIGSPTDNGGLRWSIVPGSGTGEFLQGGFPVGSQATNLQTGGTGPGNFSTVSNAGQGPLVEYVPGSGDELVELALETITMAGSGCVTQFDTVRLFFYPELTASFTEEANGMAVTGGAAEVCSGETYDVAIAMPAGVFGDDPNGAIPHYRYTINDPSGQITGLPVDGIGEAIEFDAVFNNLTLTNTSGASATATINVFVFFDINDDDMVDANECEGPVSSTTITVFPQAQATVSVNNGTNNTFCDDGSAEFRVTGSPNSTVTYTLDLGDGNGPGADQMITLGASGTNGGINGEAANFISVPLTGLDGNTVAINLNNVEYTTAPECPRSLDFTRTISVVTTPDGSIALTNSADADFCNNDPSGSYYTGISYTFTTPDPTGSYILTITESVNGAPAVSANYSVSTTGIGPSSGTFDIAFPTTNPAGQVVTYTLTGIQEANSSLGCTGTPTTPSVITVTEQAEPAVAFSATAAGTTENVSAGNAGSLTVCDDTDITFDNIVFPASLVAGDTPGIMLSVSNDNYNLFGGSRLITPADIASLSTTLDIPNNVTTPEVIMLSFLPFYEANGFSGFQPGECPGDLSQLQITIQPTITATLSANPAAVPVQGAVNDLVTVCDGDPVTFTINSPGVNGTANVVLAGGANQNVSIVNGIGTFTVPSVTGPSAFTLVDITANGCSDEFNSTIDLAIEEIPTGMITVTDDDICLDGTATITFTGIGGENDGYTFIVSGTDPNGMSTLPASYSTNGTSVSVPASQFDFDIPGDYTFRLNRVENLNGLMCGTSYINTGTGTTATMATVVVEEEPQMAITSNTFSGSSMSTIDVDNATPTNNDFNNEICSGDAVVLSASGQSSLTSTATGDALYYYLSVVTDETGTLNSGDAFIAVSSAGNTTILNQVFTNSSATNPANVSFLAIPFYAPASPTPTLADINGVNDFCFGEDLNFGFAVLPIPEADFGSNQTICYDSPATVDFTGTPGATVAVEVLLGDAQTGTLGAVGTTDVITLDNTGSAFFTTGNMVEDLVLRITNTVSADGCVNTEILDVTIVVLSENDAEFATTGPVAICEGATAMLSITGTPDAYAIYTVGSRTDSVLLDGMGNGTLVTNPMDADSTYTITAVSKTVVNQSGNNVYCVNAPTSTNLSVDVDVEAAPLGRITAMEPVCSGTENPQLRFDTTGVFVGSLFDVMINGVAYTGLADGDIITINSTLTTNTTYNLEEVVNASTGSLGCTDVIVGTISSAIVMVEAIPTATAMIALDGDTTFVVADPNATFEFTDTVCSGTIMDFNLVGTPLMSQAGDPIAYRILLDDPTNLLGFGAGMNDVSLTATDFNTAFASQFPRPLVNNGGPNPPPATIDLRIIPFYQETPGNNQLAPNSCPGDTVAFFGAVLGELNAVFTSPNATVCEDSTTTLTFNGTPNIEISFFDGNQVITVETDGMGNASYTTTALTGNRTYTITGFATVPPALECTQTTFTGDSRTITVTPTPTLEVDRMASDTVICNDGSAATIVLTSNSPNAEVTYSVGAGPDQTFQLTGTTGSLSIPGLMADATVNFSEVTTDPGATPTCPAPIDVNVGIDVQELPDPTLSNDGPVCAGQSVELSFGDDSPDAIGPYSVVVQGPAGTDATDYTGGAVNNSNPGTFGNSVVFNGVSVGAFTTVGTPGLYKIVAIRDQGKNPSAGCAPAPDVANGLASTTVVIDDEPNLVAIVASQAAVIGLSQGGISIFNTTVCNGENIDVDFQSMNMTSNSGFPLFGELTSISDPAGLLTGYLPAEGGTLSLADLDFNEDLENNTSVPATVSFTVTPFYESDGTAGLGSDECAGRTLSFNVTVLPQIFAELVSPAPGTAVCDEDQVSFTIEGTVGAQVTFFTNALTSVSETSPVTIPSSGTITITGTADRGINAFATISLSEVSLVTNSNGVNVTCTEALIDDVDVQINSLPTGFLIVDDAGPICAGDEITVGFETAFGPGMYTLVINGETFMADASSFGVNPFLFRDEVVITLTPAADTTFNLTSVTFNPTGCTSTGMPLDDLTVLVNDVPAGTVSAVDMNGLVTTASASAGQPAIVCTGDSLTLNASFDMGVMPPAGAANYVSVNFDGTGNFFGQPAGPTGTIAVPVADFTDEFSARFQNLTNNVQTANLEVTYYFETNFNDTLDMDECVGETVFLDIEILPNPIAADVDLTICSNEAVDFDLSAAITNGVTDVTYTYTVDPSASGLIDTNRVNASPANIVIPAGVLTNTTSVDQTVVFTVTPATGATMTTSGCSGNDFTFTLTVQPAPTLISTPQNTPFCSQEEIGIEFGAAGTGVSATDYDIVSIEPSVPFGPTVIAAAGNAVVGPMQAGNAIESDVFTNYTSDTLTVTYSVAPTGGNNCVGDTVDVVATIIPEPFVMNLRDTVCSGVRLDIDVIQDLVINQVGRPASIRIRRQRLAGVQNFFVLDGNDNDDQINFNNNAGLQVNPQNHSYEVIRDSILNFTTGGIDLVYNIEVNNEQGCGRNEFTYTLRVVPEATATLDVVGAASFCTGESVTLNAGIMGGSAPTNIQYVYSVINSDAGVLLDLTPSGSTVSVAAAAGTEAGNATIAVSVSDAATGCTATATQVVTVGVTPEDNPIIGSERPCASVFSQYLVRDRGNTYSWSLSDPSIAQIIPSPADTAYTVVFNSNAPSGPFIITMTETSPDGCENVEEIVINLVQDQAADFFFQLNNGGDPLSVAFTDNSDGTISDYNWTFGDMGQFGTSTLENPTVTFPDNPVTPGAPYDIEVTLSVTGLCSNIPSTITKTVTVNSAVVCDDVQLNVGVNFITFNVEPTDSAIANVFATVPGLQQVIGYANGFPQRFSPSGGGTNTPGMVVSKGAGYVVITSQASVLTACGLPIAPSFKRPLNAGVNYIGYMDIQAVSADAYFASLVDPVNGSGPLIVARTFGSDLNPFTQTYTQTGGGTNSLITMTPGRGYLVVVSAAGAGTFLGNPGNTENFEFLHGTVGGADYVTGAPVDILNSNGEVIGHIVTDSDGNFVATPIFGEVARADGSFADGLAAEEAISFRYDGMVIEAGTSFHGNWAVTEVNLDFSSTTTSVVDAPVTELSMQLAPNPVKDRATVTIFSREAGPAEVVLMDVNGRVVAQVYTTEALSVGETVIEWSDAANLKPGIYSLIVLRDGRLVKEATQRLIKQ